MTQTTTFAYDTPRKAAYLGVDGTAYRILVPVRKIWLARAEGPSELCRDWTFTRWHDASWQLMGNARTAPEGGAYDKHDFTATFADGFTWRGRFDLRREMSWPRLEDHIRDHLTFLADNRAAQALCDSQGAYDEMRAEARRVLATYELGQGGVIAPSHWPIVHDYVTSGSAEPFAHRALIDRVWPEGLEPALA